MRALVVFESMFGNTERIARAVAEGLAPAVEVEVAEIATAPVSLAGVDLLIVGSPTHAFGMSRASTRQDARQRARGGVVSRGDGLREWLAALPEVQRATAAAAFDTRIDKPRVPGSAARGADRRLRRLGFTIASAPQSFFVADVAGPSIVGELQRAREWGEGLAAHVLVAPHLRTPAAPSA
jgi:flavorubredoxin